MSFTFSRLAKADFFLTSLIPVRCRRCRSPVRFDRGSYRASLAMTHLLQFVDEHFCQCFAVSGRSCDIQRAPIEQPGFCSWRARCLRDQSRMIWLRDVIDPDIALSTQHIQSMV